MLFRKNQPATSRTWSLDMDRPGVLRITKSGSSLAYEDVRALTERLISESVDQTLSEIVFDFSSVSKIDAPWTPVVAQLLDFARRSAAACSIAALHGQPAAIIGLLLRDAGCRELLRTEDLPPVNA